MWGLADAMCQVSGAWQGLVEGKEREMNTRRLLDALLDTVLLSVITKKRIEDLD